MPTKVHFLNVGQGNMTLLQLSDGKNFLYDCNVTNDNEDEVLRFLANQIGWNTIINTFICSHRDADHMRGVKKIHEYFPIQHVWDSGVTGTTPNSSEYRDYMDLRRSVGFTEIGPRVRYDYGDTRLRIMNSKNEDLASNANAQSIVIKVVHKGSESILLTGDTDAATWKDIRRHYNDNDLSCSLLLASHHGSVTYFDDPADTHYYTSHLQAKSPAMTIISVGDNAHGHPNTKSIEFYTRHSTGSNHGNKVFRTDEKGHISAVLKDEGGWSLSTQR